MFNFYIGNSTFPNGLKKADIKPVYKKDDPFDKTSYRLISILPVLSKAFERCLYDHGIIIQTGITCKKIPCYMRDSACRWFIVKKSKIFQSYVKHF